MKEVSTESGVDLDHGRLHNIAGDTWATPVLLIGTDRPSTELERQQRWPEPGDATERRALAVVLIAPRDAEPDTGWTITVEDSGTMHISALDLDLTAEQLPASEAAALAELLALATRTDDEPPTRGDGTQPWDEFADTTDWPGNSPNPQPGTPSTASSGISRACSRRPARKSAKLKPHLTSPPRAASDRGETPPPYGSPPTLPTSPSDSRPDPKLPRR